MQTLKFARVVTRKFTIAALAAGVIASYFAMTATAQAPRRAPSPGSLWAQPTGHVQKVSAHELWGDVYCSGGTICHHGCGCGLLHHVGRTVLRTLDCLLPCHHCGAKTACGCTGRVPMGRPVCHPCHIPSVRFCKPTPGCGHRVGCGCADRPTMVHEAPVLIQPPVPQPEAEPAPKPQKSAQATRRNLPTTIASRIAQPASLKTNTAAQAATPLKSVSYEQPTSTRTKSDGIPVNPLRQTTRR